MAIKTISLARTEKAKLDMDILHTLKIFSILLPIFAFSGGFVYIYILLHQFSLSPASYFSVNDYIGSAINQLMHASIYSGIAIFMMAKGRLNSFKRSSYSIKKENRSMEKIGYFSIITCFVSWFFLKRIDVLLLGVVIGSAIWLPNLLNKILKRSSQQVCFIVFVLAVYLFNLASAAYSEASSIRNNSKITTSFHFKNKALNKNLITIIQNSKFCFMFDKLANEAIIIPITDLEFITIPNNS